MFTFEHFFLSQTEKTNRAIARDTILMFEISVWEWDLTLNQGQRKKVKILPWKMVLLTLPGCASSPLALRAPRLLINKNWPGYPGNAYSTLKTHECVSSSWLSFTPKRGVRTGGNSCVRVRQGRVSHVNTTYSGRHVTNPLIWSWVFELWEQWSNDVGVS
jgi:hypothetical protein